MSVVNVLTPHGRRQNVKVQPNTPIIKVLEEVCDKYKFDPNEYDLLHHKRILDLTTTYRFSGLPNNAQLEMIEAQRKRTDAEVELVVQLTDGNRLDGKFKPNATLYDIMQQLCPDECNRSDLVVIYMRTETTSDKLAETSLKDFGLLCGRAIFRLMHRDPNAAKIQANVALNLQSKPGISSEENEQKPQNPETEIRKTESSLNDSNNLFGKAIKEEVAAQREEYSKSNEDADMQMSSNNDGNQIKVENETKMDISPSISPSQEEAQELEQEDEDSGEVHILGDRNAVLFTLDSARSANLNELPDSFFELNVNDLKLLIKELRTEAGGTADQLLMTAKLREMEEEQNQLSRLNRYKTVIIRIQFPNRYVLQGTFTPYETIETVMEFVQPYLLNQKIDFCLYTTPPKSIISKELRLFEANCVPSAVLHFGSDEKQTNYLKEEIYEKVSSARASLKQALEDRGMNAKKQSASETTQSSTFPNQRQNTSNAFRSLNTGSDSTKLPKWLKTFGK